MFGSGSIFDQFSAGSALLVTAIALGGFLGHVGPALRGEGEMELRRATARGGLWGFAVGAGIGVLSAFSAILGA